MPTMPETYTWSPAFTAWLYRGELGASGVLTTARTRSDSLAHELDEVSVRVAKEGVAVVVSGVVRFLDGRDACPRELGVDAVGVVGPEHDRRGRSARRGVDAVHAFGRLDSAQAEGEASGAVL